MTSIWNNKDNFILLHFLVQHEQSSLVSDQIDWSRLVNDISSEISSTPSFLKAQYEFLLNQNQPVEDLKNLYLKVKENYLNLLSEKFETNQVRILDVTYEFIRHIRAQRISTEDIKKLIDERKSTKNSPSSEDFSKILKRLSHFALHLLKESAQNQTIIEKQMSTFPKEAIEIVSDNEEKMIASTSSTEKTHVQHVGNTRRSISNSNGPEKTSPNRPRSQSLTNKVNIGYEWFTPKLQHGQRSSLIQMEEVSSTVHHSIEQINDDKVTTSNIDENLRQTEVQPTISWAPITEEQAAERERQRVQLKYFDYDNVDQVSSSDCESIEVETSTVSDHSSKKRQRLS